MKLQAIKGISWKEIKVPPGKYGVIIEDDKRKTIIAGKLARKVVDSKVWKFDDEVNLLTVEISEYMTMKDLSELFNSILK